MSFDINKIREKLAKMANRGQGTQYWKPTLNSEVEIRLLSFPDVEGEPFKELKFYYNIGKNRGLLAPSQFGDADPIQELIDQLKGDNSEESKNLRKQLYPKSRFYAPIIVRGEEEKGVQIWGFSKTVYVQLYTWMATEEVGNITDPYTGRDMVITYTKPHGKQYPETTTRPRMSTSKAASTEAALKNVVDSIPKSSDLFSCKPYDELKKIVNDWINGDTEEEEAKDGTTRGGGSSGTDATKELSGDYKSLDDAFNSLGKA